MYKAILFDFDDTLVDTRASKIPAIVDYCRLVHSVEVSSEQVTRNWGIPFMQMMRELTGSQEIHTARYLEISAKYPLVPFPESQSVLAKLAAKWPIGIVTSVARPVLLHSIDALRWNQQWFSVLIAEGDVAVHKPDPGVFEPAFHALQLTDECRERVVYVGDSVSDGKAAISAGMRFIGIARDTERQRLFDIEGWQWSSSLEGISRAVQL
jgi:phosphoglycolate phosphatase